MQKIQNITLLILVLFLILWSFSACNDGFEDYSRNPQDRLIFSTDTLSFDTVLTTVHSPVRAFMVYNPNSKPLLISSISLAEGENSNFRINVDGFAGSVFSDIEILANDSIYILVSVKPAETGEPMPTPFSDYVVFITNSVQQKVVLKAFSQDVYRYKELVLDRDTTLSNFKPYLIHDSLVINEGVTVEIQEGTTFFMDNNAMLIVRGTLKIRGTVENPVTFRGSRTDYLPFLPPIPYDLIPGQWRGIAFDSTSYDNEFENVRIRNGRFGMIFRVSDPFKEKITMKNVVLTNVSGTLVEAVNCNIIAENCELSNAKDYLLYLVGGRYKFTHCTVANYYPSLREAGWGNSENRTLALTDKLIDSDWETTEHYPVLGFDISNSIIAGVNTTTSRILVFLEQEPSEPLNFQNCVFTNVKPDISYINYTDCIFQVKFDSLFKKTDYINEQREFLPVFDFGLLEDSPARNIANLEISQQIPYDILGVNRLEDGLPDAGAYEFVINVPQ
jgi:hypothetical protein